MITGVAEHHPKQKLLLFVTSRIDDRVRANVRDLVNRLRGRRRWLIAPPTFVTARDIPQDLSRGDSPVETVGAYLEIFTALSPWNLPREIDLQHLEEVEVLVDAAKDLSRKQDLTIEFELDGKFVGAIDRGEMDQSLAVGLVGEWKRGLGLTSSET